MALAPILRIARCESSLAQSSPIDRLGDDLPDLPRHTMAIRIFTMCHARPRYSYEASKRERNIRLGPESSARLPFLRGSQCVEQEGDALDLAGGNSLARSPALELLEWSLEPPNGIGRFLEEHGKLDEEQPPHTLPPDPLVHVPSELLDVAHQCGMMTAEDKPS